MNDPWKNASPRPRPKGCFRTIILFVLLGLVAAAAWWVRHSVNTPLEHSAADKIITIEQGTSTQAIINKLEEEGVIRHPAALKLYLAVTRQSSQLKAGDYKFDSPISPLQALDKIRRGDVAYERVTIPEGLNRFEIAARLAEKTGKATEQEFLRLFNDPSPISDIDSRARNLEGYLFPDTYNYTAKTAPEELVRAMVERFKDVFKPEWAARASQLNMSVRSVVTLASIIEEEARVPDERPVISSVFGNRLRIDMPLASDPTFIYAAVIERDYDGNPNNPRHRRRDSLYNTYIYSGLPPGPIASPGRASIEAALYPADTDYLYFVVNGTEGRHKFSRTADEHETAVQQYRQQQREQRERANGGSR